MPPYSGNDTLTMVREGIAPARTESDDGSSATDVSKSPSKFNAILDFNPCQSMSSAVFKKRKCHYCGTKVNKITGYEKEVVTNPEGEMVKIYTMKWCSQLLVWKEAHSEGWTKVMAGLIGHFRAIELAEQRRREEEERARREAARKAEEARRKAEAERQAKLAEQRQRAAEEEAARVAKAEAEALEAEARARKVRTLKYKVGKKFSPIKKMLRKGKKNKDAEESNTDKTTE